MLVLLRMQKRQYLSLRELEIIWDMICTSEGMYNAIKPGNIILYYKSQTAQDIHI